jgi:hypothetical protein
LGPAVKGVSGWTHYAGNLIWMGSIQKYAIDGWLLASAMPPRSPEVEKWHIDDDDILFGAKGKVASAGEPQKK